jgi:dynein light intermediate chain 1
MARSQSKSRPGSSEQDMWSTLLDKVASGKRLPDKKLIVLGGSIDSQRDFVDSLAQQQQQKTTRLRKPDQKNAAPVLATRFGLGYTYHNLLDTDHDDMVARLSLYTLSTPDKQYAPLLARLLTPQAIPNTAAVILLDWAKPWDFIHTLRQWVRLLNLVTSSLDEDAQVALQENMAACQQRRHRDTATSMTDNHTPLPLGPGEHDDPLGLPLLVVCQNAQHIESLEKERGYREAHFDYILQFLRTVLLKHGAGLVYTMPAQPGSLQPLVHHALDVNTSPDGPPKHNVVDRDRVLVPPGWDSWGKIRVLREGFDVEGISRAWGVEIQHLPSSPSSPTLPSTPEAQTTGGAEPSLLNNTTTSLYSQQIQNPHPPAPSQPKLEVECTPDQTFLASQSETLDRYRAEDEQAKKAREARRVANAAPGTPSNTSSNDDTGSRAMAEHVGPVQFNMGGIQYDADEVLRRLKVCIRLSLSVSISSPEHIPSPRQFTNIGNFRNAINPLHHLLQVV